VLEKIEKEATRRIRDRARYSSAVIDSPRFFDNADDEVGTLSQPSPREWRWVTLDDLANAIKKEIDAGLLEPSETLTEIADLPPKPTSLPPITVIPKQNAKDAIAFRPSRSGPLELETDPPKDLLDPEQSQLYLRVRLQLTNLKEGIPAQERVQIDDVVNDFLDQPAALHAIEYKKVLWLCGNALRSTLAEHDAVKGSLDPHYSKLPPSLAEALRRTVETWNVFALGDSDLVELDAKRRGPQEQKATLEIIDAARPLVEAAALDRLITTEHAGSVLTATLKAADERVDNINTMQAQVLAEGTSRNLIIQVIRQAYLFCDEIINPKTDEARALALEYKKGAAKAAGATTVAAFVATATYGAPYAVSFFEYVFLHAVEIKDYIVVAFQNAQLSQVIDAIQYTRSKLNGPPTAEKP
jgi:hypothetical protein